MSGRRHRRMLASAVFAALLSVVGLGQGTAAAQRRLPDGVVEIRDGCPSGYACLYREKGSTGHGLGFRAGTDVSDFRTLPYEGGTFDQKASSYLTTYGPGPVACAWNDYRYRGGVSELPPNSKNDFRVYSHPSSLRWKPRPGCET